MKNICDWNNCNKIGDYKAPVEKDNSKKYRMLCLEHVKEFNKNWNYLSVLKNNELNTSNAASKLGNIPDLRSFFFNHFLGLF